MNEKGIVTYTSVPFTADLISINKAGNIIALGTT